MTGVDPIPGLPVDPDIDIADAGARAPHLRVGLIALVAVGGVLGTAARAGLALVVPKVDGLTVSTLGVNLVGAFVLGALLERLARSGPDTGTRRRARLFVGTGVLGGFTTYSSLASESAVLLLHGFGGLAAGYAIGTVLLGGVASWLGILVSSARRVRT